MTDLRGTAEAAIVLGIDYKPNSMDYILELKENEQEAPELDLHYGIYEQIPVNSHDHTDS